MPDPTNPPSNPDSTPAQGPEPRAARRRLLQGGLAAAPVLMTLVSRPVLAGAVQTPSAFCSGNTSTPGITLTSSGQTPTYWTQPQNFGAWRPPYYPVGTSSTQQVGLIATQGSSTLGPTLFDSVFKPHYRNKSLLDVLKLQGGSTDQVARYCVAVVLNIAAGWTPVITVNTVKQIWSEYLTKGYFEPTAGIHWDAGQIVQYLKSTI